MFRAKKLRFTKRKEKNKEKEKEKDREKKHGGRGDRRNVMICGRLKR
jgi:hypothetical protein